MIVGRWKHFPLTFLIAVALGGFVVVNFQTRRGAVYSLNHNTKEFLQVAPNTRRGPLWNSPSVKVGERVTIWTSSEGTAARVIETDIVVKREVSFE